LGGPDQPSPPPPDHPPRNKVKGTNSIINQYVYTQAVEETVLPRLFIHSLEALSAVCLSWLEGI
jgi:hypothetical protein